MKRKGIRWGCNKTPAAPSSHAAIGKQALAFAGGAREAPPCTHTHTHLLLAACLASATASKARTIVTSAWSCCSGAQQLPYRPCMPAGCRHLGFVTERQLHGRGVAAPTACACCTAQLRPTCWCPDLVSKCERTVCDHCLTPVLPCLLPGTLASTSPPSATWTMPSLWRTTRCRRWAADRPRSRLRPCFLKAPRAAMHGGRASAAAKCSRREACVLTAQWELQLGLMEGMDPGSCSRRFPNRGPVRGREGTVAAPPRLPCHPLMHPRLPHPMVVCPRRRPTWC